MEKKTSIDAPHANKDCVCYIEKNGRPLCKTFNDLMCAKSGCSQYKTMHDIQRDSYMKSVKNAAKDPLNRKTRRDCMHWNGNGRTCDLREAPFCSVESCSEYIGRDAVIYWVGVRRTNTGWETTEDENWPRGVR